MDIYIKFIGVWTVLNFLVLPWIGLSDNALKWNGGLYLVNLLIILPVMAIFLK